MSKVIQIICVILLALFISGVISYLYEKKNTKVTVEDPLETEILNLGYIKTTYTEDTVLYTDFTECVEYNKILYCK